MEIPKEDEMKAQKWNYKTNSYEDYELPEGSLLHTSEMETLCKCASCGTEMVFGNGYCSLEIQAQNSDLGYCVCSNCHNKELARFGEYFKSAL